MSLLDVSSSFGDRQLGTKKGADERPQAFVNLCIDGYTDHLIGALFSLLEIVCVGDLGDRTHGDRICWDLFGKPTEKTRMVRRKTRGQVPKMGNFTMLGESLGDILCAYDLWI